MTDPIRAALERAARELQRAGDQLMMFNCLNLGKRAKNEAHAARAALAAPTPPVDPDALAARPLLEAVAQMGDCIGQHTVGRIMALSNRAASWLNENPPGQPVAIEPRGCPTPGACSCVQPVTPTPPADGEAIGPEWRPCVKLPITVHVRDQRPGEARVSTREGITRVRPDDLIMRGVHGEEYPIGRDLFNRTYRLGAADPGDSAPAPAADGEREEREELAAWVEFEADNAQELGCATIYDHDRLRWVAGYLRQPAPAPVPVPVAERPWERPGWCDTEGRCWWGDGKTAWLLDDPKPWALIDKIGIYLLPHWAIPIPTPTEPTTPHGDPQ